MEEVPLFHVKNLACAYKDSKNIVLKIKELIIPRNKLIFLLGASGSGNTWKCCGTVRSPYPASEKPGCRRLREFCALR